MEIKYVPCAENSFWYDHLWLIKWYLKADVTWCIFSYDDFHKIFMALCRHLESEDG